MINKSTQVNPDDYVQLLEYKLQQDIIAHKKVLKWANTVQRRIEKTRKQLDNYVRYRPIQSEDRIQVDINKQSVVSNTSQPNNDKNKMSANHPMKTILKFQNDFKYETIRPTRDEKNPISIDEQFPNLDSDGSIKNKRDVLIQGNLFERDEIRIGTDNTSFIEFVKEIMNKELLKEMIRLNELNQKVNERLMRNDSTNAEFYLKMSKVDMAFGNLNSRVLEMENKTVGIDVKVANLNSRILEVGNKAAGIDTKLCELSTNFEQNHQEALKNQDENFETLKTLLISVSLNGSNPKLKVSNNDQPILKST